MASNRFSRSLALFLTLALILPAPVSALREPSATEKKKEVLAGLVLSMGGLEEKKITVDLQGQPIQKPGVVFSVSIPTQDGKYPVVFLIHGLGSGRMNRRIDELVQRLIAMDRFVVVRPDLRNHQVQWERWGNDANESAGTLEQLTLDGQFDDLAAVVRYLEQNEPKADLAHTALYGVSMGGFVARRVAALSYQGDSRFKALRVEAVVDNAGNLDLHSQYLRDKILEHLAEPKDWLKERNLQWHRDWDSWEGYDPIQDLNVLPLAVRYFYALGEQDPVILSGSDLYQGVPVSTRTKAFFESLQQRGMPPWIEKNMAHSIHTLADTQKEEFYGRLLKPILQLGFPEHAGLEEVVEKLRKTRASLPEEFEQLQARTDDVAVHAELTRTREMMEANLGRIIKKVESGQIDPTVQLRLSESDPPVSAPPSKRPVRLGVLGGTFDPLQMGHLDFILEAIAALDLDAVIVPPPGNYPGYKDQKLDKIHRHEIARLALEPFSPLIRYSSYGLDHDETGPVSLALPFFELNPQTETGLFYLAGSDALSGSARNLERGAVEFDLTREDFNRIRLVTRARRNTPLEEAPYDYERLEKHPDGSLGIVRGLTQEFLVHELSPDEGGIASTQVRLDLRRNPFVSLKGLEYIDRHGLYAQAPSPPVSKTPAVSHRLGDEFFFALDRVPDLSERDRLIRQAAQQGPASESAEVSFITAQGVVRKTVIPIALEAREKRQMMQHLTALGFNTALFGGTPFLIVRASGRLELEREITQAIQEEFDGRYQRYLLGNVNPGQPVRVLAASSQEGQAALQTVQPFRLPKQMLFDPRHKGFFLGLDVGSESIRVVGIKDGTVVYERSGIPTQAKNGGQAFVEAVTQSIRDTISKVGEEPMHVALGVPGLVANNDIMEFGFVAGTWNETDRQVARGLHGALSREWKDRFGISVHTDVKGAATAIATEEPEISSAYVLWLGSGVGGAVVIDHQPYLEPTQFGMLKVAMLNDRGEHAGRVDHVQNFASGVRLREEAVRLGLSTDVQVTQLLQTASQAVDKQGAKVPQTKEEVIARRLVNRAAEFLAKNIVEQYQITSLSTVILGGGLVQGTGGDLLLRLIQEKLRERVTGVSFELRRTKLNPQTVGALGFARLASIENKLQRDRIRRERVKQRMALMDAQIHRLAEKGKREGPADIVVMIPMHRAEPVGLQVIQRTVEGLAIHYPQYRCCVLVVGSDDRPTDFQQQVEAGKKFQTGNVRVLGFLKQEKPHPYKAWALRAGMKFAQEIGALENPRPIFLAVDSDIRNLTPDWIKALIDPMLDAQGPKLVFSSYTVREYKEDDRPVKDHFNTPFLSAMVGLDVLEAEGEYGIVVGPLLTALLNDESVWAIQFPEFYFIPKAVAMNQPVAGVNFNRKDHHFVRYAVGRVPEYARAFFDQLQSQPFLAETDSLVPVTTHDLPPDAPSSISVNIDPEEYLGRFKEDLPHHETTYQGLVHDGILPAEIHDQIEALSNPLVSVKGLGQNPLTDKTWAQIIFAFLDAYQQTSESEKASLLGALVPLLYLRVASFALEVHDLTFVQTRQVLQRQTQRFTEARDTFLEKRRKRLQNRLVEAKHLEEKRHVVEELRSAANSKDLMAVTMTFHDASGVSHIESAAIPRQVLQNADGYNAALEYLADLVRQHTDLWEVASVDLAVNQADMESFGNKLVADIQTRFQLTAEGERPLTWRLLALDDQAIHYVLTPGLFGSQTAPVVEGFENPEGPSTQTSQPRFLYPPTLQFPQQATQGPVTITGSTGLIGRVLVEHMLVQGHPIQALVRSGSPRVQQLPSSGTPLLTTMEGDLLSLSTLREVAKQPGTVYLLGAITDLPSHTPESEAQLIAVNGLVPGLVAYLRDTEGSSDKTRLVFVSSHVVYWIGPQRLQEINENTPVELAERAPEVADWVRRVADEFRSELPNIIHEEDLNRTLVPIVRRFLDEEYAKGTESIFQKYYPHVYPYKLAKWLGEELVRDRENLVVVRFTNSYGPGHDAEYQSQVAVLNGLLRGWTRHYPARTRDYVFIGDTVEILEKLSTLPAIEHGLTDVVHIGSGQNIPPSDFKQMAERMIPGSGKVLLVQPPAVFEPPRFNVARAEALLGRKMTPFENGLARHIDWLKQGFGEFSFSGLEEIRLPAQISKNSLVILTPATADALGDLAWLGRGGAPLQVGVIVQDDAQEARIRAGLEEVGGALALRGIINLSRTGQTLGEAVVAFQVKAWAEAIEVFVIEKFEQLRGLGRLLKIPDISFRSWLNWVQRRLEQAA